MRWGDEQVPNRGRFGWVVLVVALLLLSALYFVIAEETMNLIECPSRKGTHTEGHDRC